MDPERQNIFFWWSTIFFEALSKLFWREGSKKDLGEGLKKMGGGIAGGGEGGEEGGKEYQ